MSIIDFEERLRAADEASALHQLADPKPLPEGLPDVEALDPAMLPPRLRPWVMDIAERMQCPPDFPAAAVLVALGSVIGRHCGIRPKRHDDWTVIPNLWGAAVGRPGVMKSPAIEEALKPLHRLEVQAGEAHASAMRAYETEQNARVLERKAKEEKAKSDLKKGTATREEIIGRLAELSDGDDEEPVRIRYVVNDATVEKLGELLAGNPAGLLLVRDELIGWLRSFDRDGHEGDRAFFLEAWNGTGRFTYDRIGRGTVEIPAACVSVFGGIQPGPLLSYLSRYALNGAGDDGLLQRLQVVVWPDTLGGMAERRPSGRTRKPNVSHSRRSRGWRVCRHRPSARNVTNSTTAACRSFASTTRRKKPLMPGEPSSSVPSAMATTILHGRPISPSIAS